MEQIKLGIQLLHTHSQSLNTRLMRIRQRTSSQNVLNAVERLYRNYWDICNKLGFNDSEFDPEEPVIEVTPYGLNAGSFKCFPEADLSDDPDHPTKEELDLVATTHLTFGISDMFRDAIGFKSRRLNARYKKWFDAYELIITNPFLKYMPMKVARRFHENEKFVSRVGDVEIEWTFFQKDITGFHFWDSWDDHLRHTIELRG